MPSGTFEKDAKEAAAAPDSEVAFIGFGKQVGEWTSERFWRCGRAKRRQQIFGIPRQAVRTGTPGDAMWRYPTPGDGLVNTHGFVDQHKVLVDQHPWFGGSTTGFGGSTPRVWWINTRLWWIDAQGLVDQHPGFGGSTPRVWWINTQVLVDQHQVFVDRHTGIQRFPSNRAFLLQACQVLLNRCIS